MEEYFDGSLNIAIIGMAARFPGAENIEQFWENLCTGKETIHFFSDDELKEAGISQAELDAPNYVKAAPVLNDIELFDAPFFDYTPMEAAFMDPQQRLLLECCWQALENAGYTGERASDAIGVYTGIKMNTYVAEFFANEALFDPAAKVLIMLGNAAFALGTRISYKLNLKGPSYMVQTACSTSLASVHLACQALLLDECRMALAGAGAVEIPHKTGYHYQPGGPASPDGHCRPFDAQAQGTVFGSGVGVVVLKRLNDALADGDHIYAVIKGSAVNNDGAVKASFTAPSVEGQTKVILEALACANVPVESISCVEAHGTGTPLGDPIEIMALTKAFRAGTNKKGFCRLGSVKSNVGHLDAAAGMAGLIKIVLALKHKKIPASLHFEHPNPEIDFTNSPFFVNTELTEWEGIPLPRRAGVSSFGFGGTNTHVILEEPPLIKPSGESRPWLLMVLSARTGTALDAATANLAAHLKQNPDVNPADVAYTLQLGRPVFEHRRAFVYHDFKDAVRLLETKNDPRVMTAVQETSDQTVVFMFSGQGDQYVNMGRDLYQVEPVFREHVDQCAALLIPHLGFDVRSVLYPVPPEAEAAAQKLTQTGTIQPALFVIEYALARLWQSWGIVPQALIGYSIGEYVAACLAGVFSLEDGLALVAARGRLMQKIPAGAMLTVALPEQEVLPLLNQHLSLAAINGQHWCVVSGPGEAVKQLEQQLTEKGVSCRRLATSHAFHSAMMEPIVEPFIDLIKGVSLNSPQIPYISNVSGTWITAEEAMNPRYWADHLREPVRFAQGVKELLHDPDRVLLEVGPGRTLSMLARQCLDKDAQPHLEKNYNRASTNVEEASTNVEKASTNIEEVFLSSLRHPEDNEPDMAFLLNTTTDKTTIGAQQMLSTVGALWLAGIKIDWSGLYVNEQRRRVPLPTYPFERRRYWFESPESKEGDAMSAGQSEKPFADAKKPDVGDWFYVPSWKRSLLPVRNAGNGKKTDLSSCWLLFIDDHLNKNYNRASTNVEEVTTNVEECGLGSHLVKRLKQEGQDVVVVRPGAEFTRVENRLFVLNPAYSHDYESLLNEIGKMKLNITTIVHLWSVTKEESQTSILDRIHDTQHLGFYSLIWLAQALGKQDITEKLDLVVVSNNLQEVTGEETLHPEKATVLGPARVIPIEYPNIHCRCIDVVLPQPKSDSEHKLVDLLLAEFTTRSSVPVVAYRGPSRWEQIFEPIRMERFEDTEARLREKGVYLITGGLGEIGLLLAEYLAETVQARLILTRRSAFPAQEEWKRWVSTHGEDDEISRKIRRIQEIESSGAEIVVAAADVADRKQMQAVLAIAKERFGKINGVFHAAGIGIQRLEKVIRLIRETDQNHCNRHFQSKVHGSLVLEELLQGQNVDFCLLFSSLASVLGGLGFSAYTAANIFVDAFTHYHNRNGSSPWITVNWDTWQFNREKTGELIHGAAAAEFAIYPEEGKDAFQRILSGSFTGQLVISTGDLQTRINQLQKSQRVEEKGNGNKAGLVSLHPRPDIRSIYIAPSNTLEKQLVNIWQEVLGIEPVGINDNFFDLGGDSLVGLNLISRLKQEFHLEIPPVDLYAGPTVCKLADIINQLKGKTQDDTSARSTGLDRGTLRLKRIKRQKR